MMHLKRSSLRVAAHENTAEDCGEDQSVSPYNIANILTGLRLLAIPAFIFCYIRAYYQGVHYQAWMCLAIFILAALTDRLDGYYARKNHIHTDLGAFLDPLADKLLVCTAAICLSLSDKLAWWFTAVIIVREIIVTLLRVNLVSEQGVLPALAIGKYKTAFQLLTVGLFLLPGIHAISLWSYIGNCLMVITAVITIYSGLFYIRQWFSKT